MPARVIAVALDAGHNFGKKLQESITLIAGHGVDGDAHCGVTVKHRSRVAKDPTQSNLRQVHLIHSELFDALKAQGFDIGPGIIGENITTYGIDLLSLPRGAVLAFPSGARVEITGLRNPCKQIEALQKGLMKAMLEKRSDGSLIRKSGVMGIVLSGGEIRPDDVIEIRLPAAPHKALAVV